jgi:hypothetical protein
LTWLFQSARYYLAKLTPEQREEKGINPVTAKKVTQTHRVRRLSPLADRFNDSAWGVALHPHTLLAGCLTAFGAGGGAGGGGLCFGCLPVTVPLLGSTGGSGSARSACGHSDGRQLVRSRGMILWNLSL